MGNLVTSILMMQKKKRNKINLQFLHENETKFGKTLVLQQTEQSALVLKNLPRYQDHNIQAKGTDLNRAVVLTKATTIHQLNNDNVDLPLGTVLNVKFQQNNWFYVRTPHGIQGFVNCSICAPFEMSIFLEDISDLENESDSDHIKLDQHNVGIRHQAANFYEHDIDILYLKAIYNHKRRKKYKINNESVFQKSTILLTNNDYEGTKENTLTVERGERVQMIHNYVKGWFWVRNKRNEEGFIPAAIISYILE